MKATAIVSGGMDSVTLAYDLKDKGFALDILSFHYGQRHSRELECARWQADYLGATHHLIDLSGIGALLKGSALTDAGVAVPHGHYAEETMRATVVPNRNAIMLSIAWAAAAADGADVLACGVHAGDHYIYPDCRPQFIQSLNQAFRLGTEGHRRENLNMIAPFLTWTKGDIVKRGLALGVRYDQTWTCYEGGEVACGKCGSCNERLEAFAAAGAEDQIPYAR
jgi:7-cyano-7-deazaguanine synthase